MEGRLQRLLITGTILLSALPKKILLGLQCTTVFIISVPEFNFSNW